MKLPWFITLILLFKLQCLYGQSNFAVANADKMTLPTTFEACFRQLDDVLKDTFIQEVKVLPIEIATLKLEDAIGQMILFKWKLNYHYVNNTCGYSPNSPGFMNDFFTSRVKSNKIIKRIIYRGYHKYLNNISTTIEEESIFYRTLFKQTSFEILCQGDYVSFDNKLKHIEDSILNNYMTSFMAVSDTLGAFIQVPGLNYECFISGILIEKDEANKVGKIYLFDIACSNRNTFTQIDSNKVESHQIISIDLNMCFKLNYKPPTNQVLSRNIWNSYINKKYKR